MRDPARIEIILTRLREVWLKHPDLRLGQIITVASDVDDVFYVEDDKMLRGLTDMFFKPLSAPDRAPGE